METNEFLTANETTVTSPPAPGEAIAVIRTFTLTDTVFAWLCLILGYCVFRVFPASENGMGTGVVQLFIYAAVTAVMWKRGFRPQTAALAMLVFAAALCAGMMLSGETNHTMLADWILTLSFPFYVSVLCGRKLISRFLITDYLHALFGVPGKFLKEIFKALSARDSKSWKIAVRIAAGIGLALIPTAIVFGQLSYDSGFTKLMKEIFTFDVIDIVLIILRLAFGIPLAMLTFSYYLSASDGFAKRCRTPEQKEAGLAKAKKLPALTSFAAVLPVLFLYTVFVISQWQYYVSGFSGILPDTDTYAEYARNGFFELCRVAGLNYALLLFIRLFQKEDTPLSRAVARILAVLLGLFTFALLSTAASKLVLYIRVYALSTTRIYAAWFMAVLAVAFLIGIAAMFTKRIKLIPATAAVGIVLFALLLIVNVPGRVADYNVDRYISGKLDRIDSDYLYWLGDSAVPAEVRLVQFWDERDGTDWQDVPKFQKDEKPSDYMLLVRRLRRIAGDYEDQKGLDKLISSTLPVIRARQAIREAGIIPYPEETEK